jgi:hypothetical protein
MTRPEWCPLIYHDGQNLYLELPGSPGQALRFPYTEGGLNKALKHIPNITRQPGYVTGSSNIAAKVLPKAKVAKATQAKRDKAKFTEGLRGAASAAIRKLKVGD